MLKFYTTRLTPLLYSNWFTATYLAGVRLPHAPGRAYDVLRCILPERRSDGEMRYLINWCHHFRLFQDLPDSVLLEIFGKYANTLMVHPCLNHAAIAVTLNLALILTLTQPPLP